MIMITSYKSCACHRGKSTSGQNLIFIYFASYELLNFDPILSLIFALVFHNFFSLFSLIRINVKSLFPLISLIYLFVLLMIRFFGVTYLMVDVVYTNMFFVTFDLMLYGSRSLILVMSLKKQCPRFLILISLTLSTCILVFK